MTQIQSNIKNINSKIGNANLVAVSKYRTTEEILEAIEAGQKIFGENKVQEALAKWPEIKQKHPDVKLHLIGPLQTNKVKDALKIFDVIEVVDRPKLLHTILKEMEKSQKSVDCYIQVNTGNEPQKAGVLFEEAENFIKQCIAAGLPVKGLMCIPPVDEDPVIHFQRLKKLAQNNNIEILSMGMSNDYEIAVEHGATHVRIGTAIFGERNYSNI